jgi:AmmeMemoRadiSam system protein A
MKAKMDRDRSTPAARTAAAASTQHEAQHDYEDLPRLARLTVETFVREGRVIAPPRVPDSSPVRQPAACFVSIKTEHQDLRGCIGTIEPTCPTLVEELIANAVSAATRDPRFPPVTADELPYLRFSVDVLSSPEPARPEDLDPETYGVVVTDRSGRQRGLLLPAIEGVETVGQQVAIAARKAGLRPEGALKLYRFRVKRFSEQPDTA